MFKPLQILHGYRHRLLRNTSMRKNYSIYHKNEGASKFLIAIALAPFHLLIFCENDPHKKKFQPLVNKHNFPSLGQSFHAFAFATEAVEINF